MTMQQAAEKYNVSKSTISTWEKGTRSISAVDLVNYSNVLHADLNELVFIFRSISNQKDHK
jgi:transcriptional regulator with XRE-family HTH domain